MADARVPAELLRAVGDDLRPVRPLAPPWRRALVVAVLAMPVLAQAPLAYGWRSNIARLGPGWAWGVSIVQALVGLAVLVAALREAVPGRPLSRRALWTAIAAASAAVLAVTLGTEQALPAAVPPGVWLRYAWECWEISVVTALPIFAFAAWLVVRALPVRPALTGALLGLGVGVLVDSAMRLYCWVSAPLHVLVSHGGAVVTLVLGGALVTTAVDRWAGRRGRKPR